MTSVASEVDLPPSDVTDCSDTDSDSGDEIPSVDDCVKCVCEDECELGFMIQVHEFMLSVNWVRNIRKVRKVEYFLENLKVCVKLRATSSIVNIWFKFILC